MLQEQIGYPFELIREIGRGGLSVIYLAYHHRLCKYVILKRISFAGMDRNLMRVEVDVLKNLHHRYLPQVYDFLETPDGSIYTVMDYIEGISLDNLIHERRQIPQQQLMMWLAQLCEVLDYLHSQRHFIIHGDIKPANVMLTSSGNICLIDFNISVSGAQAVPLGFSAKYASPELVTLAGKHAQKHGTLLQNRTLISSGGTQTAKASALFGENRHSQRLTPQSDLYSLGAVFYALIMGAPPANNGRKSPLATMRLPYSPAFLRVIDKAVEPSLSKRFSSARALLEALVRLERFDGQYRRNRRAQWLIASGCAALLLIGIFFVYAGVLSLRAESFSRDLSDFKLTAENNSGTALVSEGLAILDNTSYEAILKKQPQDWAFVLHALGDQYFYTQDYFSAKPYYLEASQVGVGTTNAALYKRDYAICLARSGDMAQAQAVLDLAKASAVDSRQIEQLSLVEAELAYLRGESQVALELLNDITNNSIDSDLLGRGWSLKASIYRDAGDTNAQLDCLLKAYGADQRPAITRQLADAYALRAEKTSSKAQRTSLYGLALPLYQELCGVLYPSLDDQLKLVVTYRSLENYTSCEALLNKLQTEVPGDYRIPMQRAFLADQRGDKANAGGYAQQALGLYWQTSEALREADTTNNIRALISLADSAGRK